MNATLDIINRIVSLGPNRRILKTLGKHPAARRWLNYLSRSGGVFDTFSAAESARARYHPASRGHLNQNLITSNFAISATLRCSDYPVLFWLKHIASEEPLRLFDFGGGQGQTFVAMASRLGEPSIEQWMVNDLPEVIGNAEASAFPSGRPDSIRFTSELTDGKLANVFLAAGSLHYWTESLASLLEALATKPKHFIINRSPMRSDGSTYYTVQEGVHWAVPCVVREFSALQRELEEQGYELIDHWTAPEKFLHRPWLPEFSSPYQGAYFKRSG